MSNVPPNDGELRNPNQPYQQPVQPQQPQGYPQMPQSPQGYPQAPQNPQGFPQPDQRFQPAPPQMQQPFPAYQQYPGQPAYGQPQYGQTPYGKNQKTNVFAIVSLATSFFVSILGIIFGILSLSQIAKTGEKGRALAIAGIVIGVVGMIFVGAVLALGQAAQQNLHSTGLNTGPTSSASQPTTQPAAQTVAQGCKIFITAVNNQADAIQQTTTLAKTDPQTAAQQLVTESDAIAADSSNVTNPDVLASVNAVTSGLKAVGNDILNGTDPTNDNDTFQADLKTAESLCA